MKKCFECEAIEDLQEHHVIPRSKGGTKTVTLCYGCHMKAHGRDGKGSNHSKLTKEGLRAAKAKGISLGNPRRMETATPKANEAWRAKGRLTVDKYGTLIVSLRDSGLSWQKVADKLNEMQVPTPSGKSRLWRLSSVQNIYKNWHPTTVMRVYKKKKENK